MIKISTKLTIIILTVIAVSSILAYALLSWHGTISGTALNFSVWDSASGGTSLASPYSLPVSPVNASMLFHFWIQNDGSLPLNVTVTEDVAHNFNCMASWSLPINIAVTSRGEANLTLTVTGSFSYTWDFIAL